MKIATIFVKVTQVDRFSNAHENCNHSRLVLWTKAFYEDANISGFWTVHISESTVSLFHAVFFVIFHVQYW